MHALGWDNHWDGRGAGQPVPSVLSPRRPSDRRTSFTDWDILAIRAPYRGEMPPGLDRGAALERARPNLTKLLVPYAGGGSGRARPRLGSATAQAAHARTPGGAGTGFP